MDINTINLILWAPFALVGLLATLVYCVNGLTKGTKPALVSLASIFLSAILGIFIARALAAVVAPALQGMIPADLFADAGAASGMVQALLLSIVSTITAMLLFMLLFLTLTPVISAIGKAVLRKNTQDTAVTGGSRSGGAALGLVSAVLFSLIFLLPIYGSLAAYAPVVRGALDMLPEESAPAPQETATPQLLSNTVPLAYVEVRTADYEPRLLLRDVLDCILQHPLVELSSSAPVREVYNSLSQVSAEQTTVSIADMAGTMEELMNKITAVAQADEAVRAAACRELVTFCREEVLTQPWVYSVYSMAMEQAPAMLPEGDPTAEEMLEILTLNEEEFQANADALLTFAVAALEQDVLDELEKKNFDALVQSGLLAETGKLLNATEQMVELKNLFYRTALETAAEDNAAQARAFAEKYPLTLLTDPTQQEQEAEAFCILFGMDENAEPTEFFLRHPSLGEKALLELSILLGSAG